MNSELVGWLASFVLLLTLGRQVWVQWRQRATDGVSSWLFVGQLTASLGFVAYSWLVDNRIFVFTNSAIALTAVVGQLIYRRNVRLGARPAGAADPRLSPPSD